MEDRLILDRQIEILRQRAVSLEKEVREFRNTHKESLHPWSLNPLANAIGAAANCACHLGSVVEQNAKSEAAQ